ncbi:unnamed protein product [Staurois parvus]|uniref:Uncharacterized protein n=1 Tax=Staurois parvus TaxID=386267 RepID=A0ABN9CIF5_9NEOB|nr:unnamed protein product [Staurois parvus]
MCGWCCCRAAPPAQSNADPQAEDCTLFVIRAFFAIQHCANLTGNCAVMQHCTQMEFI